MKICLIFKAFQAREAVVRRCSVKRVFLETLQNSQENTCARASFLIKLKARPATLLKKRLWGRCFPVNFVKFLRTPFCTEHLWWLLLMPLVSFYIPLKRDHDITNKSTSKYLTLQCLIV